MPREFARTDRVGEQIRRELAGLIERELKDPRIGMVTLTDIQVSRDLSSARVFFSVISRDGEGPETTARALNHAAGFLRRELGRRMVLRSLPQLRFVYDDSTEKAARISALLGSNPTGSEPGA